MFENRAVTWDKNWGITEAKHEGLGSSPSKLRYSYEDFIMGYKPNDDGFELRTGTFYNFCKKAEKDTNPDSKYFFIIDEINRGKSFVEIQDESAEVDYVARLHLLLDGYTMSWPPSKLYWFSKYNSGTYSI